MGKEGRAKKRQKSAGTSLLSTLNVPKVDLLQDDSLKDDEELRLEGLLFGKTTSKAAGKLRAQIQEEEPSGMEHLVDSDLFFVDDDGPQTNSVEEDEFGSDGSEKSTEAETTLTKPKPVTTMAVNKTAAWADPLDPNIMVSLTAKTQRRKFRDSLTEDQVTGNEYEVKLRRQFEKLNPTPRWALNARKSLHIQNLKRRRTSHSSAEEGEDNHDVSLPLLTNSTLELRDSRFDGSKLSSGVLNIERLRDANSSSRSQGPIHSLAFHPNPRVPVLFTASSDRRLRLFNIDGDINPHLQTIHVPSLPLTGATFHPSGSSILLTGPRPFYYSYDLQSGIATRSLANSRAPDANQDRSLEIRRFSPTGDLLAVAGRRGYIYILDWSPQGGQQIAATLKGNSPIKDLWWNRSGKEIWAMGQDSEVCVYDIGSRRCLRKWTDEGGYGSKILGSDPQGSYLSTGSTSGFVNVYDMNTLVSPGTTKPKPLKVLGHLTTQISSLQFNSTAQIMGIASDSKKDQMRMVHLPSLTVFSNWPTSGTPLGLVKDIAFSPGSEYVAIGSGNGCALLYNLRHFSGI